MLVEDNRKQESIDLFELNIGDVFEKNSKIYIKIGSFACLNVKEGKLEEFGSSDKVNKIKAKLIIGEE